MNDLLDTLIITHGSRADGIILEGQWLGVYAGRHWTPEERLLYACLEDAVLTLITGKPKSASVREKKDGTREKVYEQTREWFADTDANGLFSFNNIWTVLFSDEWDVEIARYVILNHPERIWQRLLKMRAERNGRKYEEED